MKYPDIVKKLTLEEKAAILTGRNTFESLSIDRVGISSLFFSDGPHGVRKQLGAADHLGLNESRKATCFPVAAAMANSWDVEMAEKVGEALGEEAAAQDVDVLLGPGLNIKRSPLCGRNFEYFSEDPYLSGKMAAAYIRGMQKRGVAACPKHFAVNSQELGRMVNDSVLDERTLREIYLAGFEIAVKEGKPEAIMTSYNLVNGVYANENEHLLGDILRREWGFEGAVITDWGGSNDHVAGVRAGSTLEMPGPVADSADLIIAAVADGSLDETVVDERVDELLRIAMKPKPERTAFDEAAHHALAREAAEKSIVLLKNENDMLPLSASEKVAVIGDFAFAPRYQGAGSSLVNVTRLDIPIECLKAVGLNIVGSERGFDRFGKPDKDARMKAVELAGKADVVLIYLGLGENAESEGMDRRDMRLAENQLEVLKAVYGANKNIIAVLSAGGCVESEWTKYCKAVVNGCLTGQAGAQAMVNILTGKVNPGGRLSETWPLKYEDTPAYSYYPGRERTSEYREGVYVGYRYYETRSVKVAYPFGYGLSYTRFQYTGLRVEDSKAVFVLKNTGKYDGWETAQLYIAPVGRGVFRPLCELKGFKKVFLKAGEEKIVEITMDERAFSYFNVSTGAWETEGGDYEVRIGASCRDIRLKESITIDGTGADNPYENMYIPSYASADVQDVSLEEFEQILGRPVPSAAWPREMNRNSALCQMRHAPGVIGRIAYRILSALLKRSGKKGRPDLNLLFIYHMPFRAMAKNAGAFVNEEMVDGMVNVVNGHFFRGMKRIVGGFIHLNREKTSARRRV